MAKRSRGWALVSWSGAGLALLILLVAVLLPAPQADWSGAGFRVAVGLDACELDVPLGGDIASCPPGMTPGWRELAVVGLADVAWFSVLEAVGVPVTGRRLRVHARTWFAVTVLLLPGLWRRFGGTRRKRKRLLAGCCVHCGYDLRSSEAECPECGATRPGPAAAARWISARMLRRRPVLTSLAMASVVLAGCIIGFTVKSPDKEKPLIRFNVGETWIFSFDRGYVCITSDRWVPDYGGQKESSFGLHAYVYHMPGGWTHRRYGAIFVYPLVLSSLLPLCWWFVWRRDQRMIAARSCRWCWFDREGATGACPRCARAR